MDPIDLAPGIPIYLQIQHALTIEIASGKIPPGARLPSLNELHGLHGCDRNTAVKVYDRLKKNGFVDSQHGRGFTVSDGAIEKARTVIKGSIQRRLREIRKECERTGIEMKE
jgi:GntR family transcriptional regulator/MocR family aminotransferase